MQVVVRASSTTGKTARVACTVYTANKLVQPSYSLIEVAITSQLSFLCFSGLHNVGLAGADTEATVDWQSSFHESRRQSQLFGCSFEVLSAGREACWALSQEFPGSGLWNAWVQVITDGPCSSQKWHRDIIAFILTTYYSANKNHMKTTQYTYLFIIWYQKN